MKSFSKPIFRYGRLVVLAAIMQFASGGLAPLSASGLPAWFASGQEKTASRPQSQTQQNRVSFVVNGSSYAGLGREVAVNHARTAQQSKQAYLSSKKELEGMCRAINARYNDENLRDITVRLFVVTTQIYEEFMENSTSAVAAVQTAQNNLEKEIFNLDKIATAPGNKTLGDLYSSIDNSIALANSLQAAVAQYSVFFEGNLQTVSLAKGTYEMLPALKVPEIDLLSETAKEIMNKTQAHGGAFKSWALTLKTNTAQVAESFENMKKLVQDTLRFSDHFAIGRFPLSNLPMVTRENIYNRLKSINEVLKTVNQSLMIADSQIKNTSAQFVNSLSAFVAKSSEYIRYNAPNTKELLTQVSNYSRNQLMGLFTRVRDEIVNTREVASKAANALPTANGSSISVLSEKEFLQQQTRMAIGNKLPLFLLGSGTNSNNQASNVYSAEYASQAMGRLPGASEPVVQNSAIPLKTNVLLSQTQAPSYSSVTSASMSQTSEDFFATGMFGNSDSTQTYASSTPSSYGQSYGSAVSYGFGQASASSLNQGSAVPINSAPQYQSQENQSGVVSFGDELFTDTEKSLLAASSGSDFFFSELNKDTSVPFGGEDMPDYGSGGPQLSDDAAYGSQAVAQRQSAGFNDSEHKLIQMSLMDLHADDPELQFLKYGSEEAQDIFMEDFQ